MVVTVLFQSIHLWERYGGRRKTLRRKTDVHVSPLNIRTQPRLLFSVLVLLLILYLTVL